MRSVKERETERGRQTERQAEILLGTDRERERDAYKVKVIERLN